MKRRRPWPTPICWSPVGLEIAFIAEDRRSIAVIDSLRKRQRIKIAAGNTTILSIACGDNDLLATACEDHSVWLWNRKTGTLLREISMEQIPLRIAFRLGSQDLLIVGEQSRRSEIWSGLTSERRLVLDGHKSWINCQSFTNDGRRLITGSEDQTVKIWDVESEEELVSINDLGEPVRQVAIDRNSRRLAISVGSDPY